MGGAPAITYGTPAMTYGAPAMSYGAPAAPVPYAAAAAPMISTMSAPATAYAAPAAPMISTMSAPTTTYAGAVIGDGCTLGVKASAAEGEQLPDETVIVGESGVRHSDPGAKDGHQQAIMKHIEVLKE